MTQNNYMDYSINEKMKTEKLSSEPVHANSVNTVLAAAYLESKGFKHHEANDNFEDLNMPYYAKDAILLFYNKDRTEYELSNYLAGYGEMRNGKLHVTTFRWINKKEQLSQIYQAIIGRGLPI